MKTMDGSRILYISNIEVPYRTKFFNLLGEKCDLTVLYEREKSLNRTAEWTTSEKSGYNKEFLGGIKLGNERAFSFRILKYVFGDYGKIVFGCFNNPTQMFAIMAMKVARREYYINVDGKTFDSGSLIKRKMRRYFLKGAKGYFCAGKKASEILKCFVGEEKPIYPYLLSSMTKVEVETAEKEAFQERNNKILVVGQYEDYKGLDIAAQVAKRMPETDFVFVGMGWKTENFEAYLKEIGIKNIKAISFLQREELNSLYNSCRALVLPSRQECWGLVINEGAAHGIPVVSTWGSGAAEEFLSPEYDRFLAKANDADSLEQCLRNLLDASEEDKKAYSQYLLSKSKKYYIEENVDSFINGIEA